MKKLYYLVLIPILIVYFIYIPSKLENPLYNDFLRVYISSEEISAFHIEFYNTRNRLKSTHDFSMKENENSYIEVKETINFRETFQIVFNQEGKVLLKNLKIKKNINLLSISINELEKYFFVNKNVEILNDSILLIKKSFPGKARIISKAIVSKTVNLK